jgi:DNA processing protein
LVQQWQDVAAELPPQIAANLLPPPFGEKKEKSVADRLSLLPQGLSGSETLVLRMLSADSPEHIDSLVNRSRLSITDLTAALLSLEMRELVRALPGRCFVRKM